MTSTPSPEHACADAADLISQSDGLLITAGAGIGIDSGLPDFRGDAGFWRAYPVLGNRGVRFAEIDNPKAFHQHPELAWGFYGHRLHLYRTTMPHAGFTMLNSIAALIPNGAFVFTSNVDQQFQRSGMSDDRVVECHGNIEKLQCLKACGQPTWSAHEFAPVVDVENCVMISALPTCPSCGGIARPNILMFGDFDWNSAHAEQQELRLEAWLARQSRTVVLEIGAGTSIPTVRLFGECLSRPLIRLNPSESTVGLRRDIGIPLGALEGITRIAEAVDSI